MISKAKPKKPIPKGLKPWDTIIGINDVLINNDVEFADELQKNKIGQTISVSILRDKRFMRIDNITLKTLPIPTDLLYGDSLKPTLPKK